MSSRPQDLINEFVEERDAFFRTREIERQKFFNGLEEGIQRFARAVKKFKDTGELDTEVLGIDLKKLNLDPEPAKKGGRRKKNEKDAIAETPEPGSARTSTSSIASSVVEIPIPKENIKVEKEDMPAPNFLPPKRKTKIKTERSSIRTTRTKGKKAAARDSDVIIESSKICTINLIDTEDSKTDKESTMRSTRSKAARKQLQPVDVNTENTRSTRTKTHKQAQEANQETKENVASAKRLSPDSVNEEEILNNKKAKKNQPNLPIQNKNVGTIAQTLYEDSQSTLGPVQDKQLNSTYVTNKPTEPTTVAVTNEPQINSTMIIEKPKFNIFDKKSNNDLFTDDESSVELNTSPKKDPVPKTTKQIFSPYAKTTLKKKVEAFEKLQNGSEIPVKMGKGARDTPSSTKEKSRIFTPLRLKFAPGSTSTTKVSKFLSSHAHNSVPLNDSSLSSKSAQKDPREYQRKLQEREEATKKKEAMLQAQAEARRKQNEDKQLKAQQQRKVLEAERLKQLEIQKQKEEKFRQRELEREEYLQKQKQELEKRKQAQKKKIQEIQAQKQQLQMDQAKERPIYMITQPPPLPTDDCYDSDDSNYRKVQPPSWCSGERSRIMQLSMLAAGEKIKNTLFCRRAQTPDLTDIFETIDPRKLKRSSSILWKRPPRYTMMPDLNETRFSEDDEFYESD